MKNLFLCAFIVFVSLFSAGCATVGHGFEFNGAESLIVGKTSEADVLRQYGDPFRVGYDSGDQKWTYGFYKYRLFGESDTKDLDIIFDKNGIVKSYTYSTSVPEEKKKFLGANSK